jgi:hypothetical protein
MKTQTSNVGHYRIITMFWIAFLIIQVASFQSSAESAVPEPNLPPTVDSLKPDQPTPQKIGAMITWRANASDPEGDTIYYRFLLNGPHTNGRNEVLRDWGKSSFWTWEPKEEDIGLSNIIVQARDDSHTDASNVNSEKDVLNYEIYGMQIAILDVQVNNDVYSLKDPKIYYCDEGGHLSINNRIYLVGSDLNKVAQVKYVLHPSFANNEVISKDAANNFEIQIMAWGRFQMYAVVTTKDGQDFQIPFAFQFKSKVQEAQSRGIPRIRQCN